MKTKKSRSKPEREDLLSSYALAQYHLGINVTLEEKRRIIGWESLQDAPMSQLITLVNRLRKLYQKKVSSEK